MSGDNSQEPFSPSPSPKVDLNKLKAELKCCICWNLFEDPRNLPCGHICCKACIQSLIDTANGPIVFDIVFGKSALYKSITCPQCREEYKVPEDGQLPAAFVVKNLVSQFKQADEAPEGQNDDKSEAAKPIGTKKLQISPIGLLNEDYFDVDENMAGIVPQNVLCKDVNGKAVEVPLHQLHIFLNEHVEGAVHRICFEFVKFTESMVQMLRRVKRERFERVDEDGEKDLSIWWIHCDFSRISEASFRFLLDELFCLAVIYITDWIGMPADFNYNTLFKLKAFRDAGRINYTKKIQPNSPNFNLHLDSEVLIDFLHSPELRMLILIDGQLQDGFDSFLDRLTDRFNKDTERRSYVLKLLVLNATDEAKERLEVGKPLVLEHPKGNGKLKFTLKKATDVRIPVHGSYNADNMFELCAERSRY